MKEGDLFAFFVMLKISQTMVVPFAALLVSMGNPSMSKECTKPVS
jgi:hypothetical protein